MQLFAASTDDLETNTRFAKELGVDYPIIADPEKKAATAMGVLMPVGFASRKTVIIGKDGKLLAIEDKVDVKNAGEQLAKKLAELKVEKKKKVPEGDGSGGGGADESAGLRGVIEGLRDVPDAEVGSECLRLNTESLWLKNS